jgi:Flp pilus assembly protein TadD
VADHRSLGLTLLGSGDSDGAVRELEAAVVASPKDVEARNALGLALASLGRLSEAKRAFAEVLELDPEYAGAWVNLGMVAPW